MSEDTLAWPAELLGGASAADATWTLEHSPDASVEVTDGAVTGGDEPVVLEYDAAGLSEAQLAKFPALEGYLALHPVGLDRGAVQQLLTEQLAVAQSTDGALSAFTGVQLPGVLDDLYADAARLDPARRERGRPGPDAPALGADGAVGVARGVGGRRDR